MKRLNFLLLSALFGFSNHAFAQAGEVVCVGANYYGLFDVPDGVFTQVAAGSTHAVALKEDGTSLAEGEQLDLGQCDAPEGTYTPGSCWVRSLIGLREDGSIVCWGYNYWGQCEPPKGTFHASGCWEFTHSVELQRRWHDRVLGLKRETRDAITPDGSFKQISAGVWHTVGLEEDGTVECWGDITANEGPCEVPDSIFTHVCSGSFHALGLRQDGTVECWGTNVYGQCNAPDLVFTQVAAGCIPLLGLSSGKSHVGEIITSATNTPEGESFTEVTAGQTFSIGLREDGSIKIWGALNYGQYDPPDDLLQVDAGSTHTVAVRLDGGQFRAAGGGVDSSMIRTSFSRVIPTDRSCNTSGSWFSSFHRYPRGWNASVLGIQCQRTM